MNKCIVLVGLCAVLLSGAVLGSPTETSVSLPSLEAHAHMPYVFWRPMPAHADAVRKFQGIASIAIAPGGRLWATWYGGGIWEGPENYVMLAASGDGGKTWSDIQLVIDPPYRASEPAVWVDPGGRLWLMWNQYPLGLIEVGSQLWAMTCDNPDAERPDWSVPRLISMEMNNFNKPTVLSDGRWLWPAGCWRFRDAANPPSRPLFSADDGKTFTVGGPVPIPLDERQFDEYQVVQRNDGTLWLLTRTRYGIGESFSDDGGKTWSQVTPSNIQHAVTRFFITRLHSGNLLLVKNGPIDQVVGRSQMMAFVSADDGQSWSKGLMLDERDNVSYPDGVQHSDGTIYIIYDYWRAVEKEILLAVFTEEDVLAGEPVSDKAHFKGLINKGLGFNPKHEEIAEAFPLLERAPVAFEPNQFSALPVEEDARLFSNRRHAWGEIPAALNGKTYLQWEFDGGAVKVTQDGVVYVVTPAPQHSRNSQQYALLEQGFVKSDAPGFTVNFTSQDEGVPCRIYQKTIQAGEILQIDRWGIVVY